MRKGILLVALTAAVTITAAAPATAAKSWKYRVDVTVKQKTDWNMAVRWPRDGFCGSADVHYVYRGNGDGDLTTKVRHKRTTFRRVDGLLESTEITMPGTVFSDAEWSVARQN